MPHAPIAKSFSTNLREESLAIVSMRGYKHQKRPYVNQPSLQALDNLNQRLRAIEERQAKKDLIGKKEHLNSYSQELLGIGASAIHKRIQHLGQCTKFYEDMSENLIA
ncbi:hypothetical protein, partial [Helicobacter bizzozeronii]|uniref:hypothetical protein n=1 Tax=Helicobacter bizzozeronii TaxID=56877 RepID=UPI001315162D